MLFIAYLTLCIVFVDNLVEYLTRLRPKFQEGDYLTRLDLEVQDWEVPETNDIVIIKVTKEKYLFNYVNDDRIMSIRFSVRFKEMEEVYERYQKT